MASDDVPVLHTAMRSSLRAATPFELSADLTLGTRSLTPTSWTLWRLTSRANG
jgi:hypothetical protein